MNIDDLMGMVAMEIRTEAVKSLLAGNDTQCFTEEQYKAAYVRVAKQDKGRFWGGSDLVRRHLESTKLVVNVGPGLWAAKCGETHKEMTT